MATTKATRKSTTSKSTAARQTTAKKAPAKATTTVRTVSSSAKPAPKTTAIAAKDNKTTKRNDDNVNIVLAELIGTFILALVAVATVTELLPLFIGLTYALLIMVVGAVSGAHLNPAVTFGLWTARKIKGATLPFYWGAQLLGGMAAVVVLSAVSGSTMGLDFTHFLDFSWTIFLVELIGTTVFLFGLTSVISRLDLSVTGRAFGVGLSLFAALVVAGSLYAPVPERAEADYLAKLQEVATSTQEGNDDGQPDYAELREVEVPRSMLIGGATLNPALALATTESTTLNEVHSRYNINDAAVSDDGDSSYSRFSAEVIVATLIGAALGANLALLVAYRFKV